MSRLTQQRDQADQPVHPNEQTKQESNQRREVDGAVQHGPIKIPSDEATSDKRQDNAQPRLGGNGKCGDRLAFGLLD